MTRAYCLTHAREVEFNSYFEFHYEGSVEFGGDFTVGVCKGPFAVCPPPDDEMTYDWVMNVSEPSEEELERMNLNARELEMDFS